MEILLKRVYDPWSAEDGFRVLVDRLWPRGLAKEAAKVDLWSRDVAPSDGLRKWFHHESPDWPEFRRRYLAELEQTPAAVADLLERLRGRSKVTLLFGAKDAERNQAAVLKEALLQRTSAMAG